MTEAQQYERAAIQMRQNAMVMSRVACFMAELEGMKAENDMREQQGLAQAYGDDAFNELPQKHGIDHNSVISTLMHF